MLQQAQQSFIAKSQEDFRNAQLQAEADAAKQNQAITDEAKRVIEQERQQRAQSEHGRSRAEE